MAKNQHTQRILFFSKSVDELQFVKKCENYIFKVNFGCQKSTEFLQKQNSFKNIDLGDQFLEKNFFFLDSTFEPVYVLKSCPIFDELTFLIGFFSINVASWPKNLTVLDPPTLKFHNRTDINTYVWQWAFFMDQNGKLEQWPLQYLGLYFHARFSRSQSACPFQWHLKDILKLTDL